jgi:phage anti-repressor protein
MMEPVKEAGDRGIRFEFDRELGIIRHRDRYSRVREYQIEVRETDGIKSFDLRLLGGSCGRSTEG